MAIDQPLSDAEIDELAEFFESDQVPADAMDVAMLHGYLTAIAIGPVTVMPSEWLPEIWGESGDPAFDSLEQARHILDLIMRYYNEIIQIFTEAPEKFQPVLYEYGEEGKRVPSPEEWCIGFSRGVHLRSEDWSPLLEDKEASVMLSPIVAFSLDEAWDEVVEGRNPDEVAEKLVALLPLAVQGMYAYWLPQREKVASGAVAESFSYGAKAKARRNGPCPCGSGKKFKKCCGVAANTRVN